MPPERVTYYERHLLGVCVDRYLADLAKACEEDQGTPDGRPGTVGHSLQAELRAVKAKLAEPASLVVPAPEGQEPRAELVELVTSAISRSATDRPRKEGTRQRFRRYAVAALDALAPHMRAEGVSVGYEPGEAEWLDANAERLAAATRAAKAWMVDHDLTGYWYESLAGDVLAAADRVGVSSPNEPSEAEVEAAAEAAFFQDDLGGHIKGRWTWSTIPEEGRENYRQMIRAALRAAASVLPPREAGEAPIKALRRWCLDGDGAEFMERWFDRWDRLSPDERQQYDGWVGGYILDALANDLDPENGGLVAALRSEAHPRGEER